MMNGHPSGRASVSFDKPEPTWRKPNYVLPTNRVILSAKEMQRCHDSAGGNPHELFAQLKGMLLVKGVPESCFDNGGTVEMTPNEDGTLTVEFK